MYNPTVSWRTAAQKQIQYCTCHSLDELLIGRFEQTVYFGGGRNGGGFVSKHLTQGEIRVIRQEKELRHFKLFCDGKTTVHMKWQIIIFSSMVSIALRGQTKFVV